jgi:hypothetical protein
VSRVAKKRTKARKAEDHLLELLSKLTGTIPRPTTPSARLLIVFDGRAWFVRRVRSTVHELTRDEMVYYCDQPLGGPYDTIEAAVAALPFVGRPEVTAP